MGNTLYDYVTTDELQLINKLIGYLKKGNKEAYKKYIDSIPSLCDALEMCNCGIKYKFAFDKRIGKYKVVPKKTEKYPIGKNLYDFINSTATVIVFTKGFSEKAKTFAGDGCEVNGLWEKGEMVALGEGEKYKRRMYNAIWISEDLKESPAAIAMILAHEYGHGLAEEYCINYVKPSDGKKHEPPYPASGTFEEDDKWCYPFEGMMAKELGLIDEKHFLFPLNEPNFMTEEAKNYYKSLIGDKVLYNFNDFREKMRLSTCLARKIEHSSYKRVCGMRCRYYDKYGYCDNPVHIPPCHLWKKHIETFTNPLKSKISFVALTSMAITI